MKRNPDLEALEEELAEAPAAPGEFLTGAMGIAAPTEVAKAGRAILDAQGRVETRQRLARALTASSPADAERAAQVTAPLRGGRGRAK